MKRIATIGIFLGVLIGGTAIADMDIAIKQFEVGNYDGALEELLAHVEAGDPTAQTMAAYIYDFGLVGEPDFELAVDYEYGYGVSADMFEAIYWHRQAAEQGHVEAQYNMAVDYSIGDGVAQDLTQGAWWMIQAGMQGHEFAQLSLGFIYRQGEGVPADPLQAYMWLALAAQNWENETAIEGLEDLESTLSSA